MVLGDHDHPTIGATWPWLKALLATAVCLVPVLLAEIATPFWKWHAIGAFGLALFFVNRYLVFNPDDRFERVRKPSLDSQLDHKFKTLKSKLRQNERLPFRVNVMKPRGRLWWRRLEIVYAYGMAPADPDYGISWPKSHGLCWQVFQTGLFAWFDRRQHDAAQFGVTADEREKTRHVVAVLSLPIRLSGKMPAGVLNIDTLSENAADFLRREKENLESQRHRQLVDLVSYFGLYYG